MRAGPGVARGKAAEAERVRDAEPNRHGWTRRTTIDEPRLSELVQTYRELGFEVIVEPLGHVSSGDCRACFGHSPGRYKTIYTRRRGTV